MEKLSTQVRLDFIVFGDTLLPEKVTDLLKIYPTNFWKKGDPIPTPEGLIRGNNKAHTRRESAWEFSTGLIKTLDVEILLDRFEKVFENKIAVLKDYIQEHNLEVSLNITVEIVDDETPSIHFHRRFIKLCGDLGAEIDVDMYVLNND